MNIKELIEKNGLDSVVKSVFKNLRGIEFDKVVFNHELNSKNPLEYMTSNVDGDWRFAIGSMTMLVKPCSEKKIDNILNQLLISNDIDINSGYKEGYDDITFWNGKGFKIEKAGINGVNVIIISNADVVPSNATKILTTKYAKDKVKPNWVLGLNDIYDGESIENDKKDFSNFINVPLLFKDEEAEDYILIKVQTFEIAKFLIDDIIDKNGGKKIFNEIVEEKPENWEYLFKGQLFVIGFQKEGVFVRLNRLPKTMEFISDSNNSDGINKNSQQINAIIKGLDSPILNGGDGGVPDGRFFTSSDDATLIISFWNNADDAIEKFTDIVHRYNDKDQIFSIKKQSIKEWLDDNPEEYVELDVKDQFRIQLSKGNALYRINIYPPGGFGNLWDFEASNELEIITPNTVFSKKIDLKPVIYDTKIPLKNSPVETEVKVEEKKINNDKEKINFLKDAVVIEDIHKKPSKKGFNFWPILSILGILFFIFFLFRSCEGRDSNWYYEKGNTDYDSGNEESALKNYDYSIEEDQYNRDPLVKRGTIYFDNENYDDAISDFDDAIDASSEDNDWFAYFLRGKSHYKKGKSKFSRAYKKALEDFEESIRLNSTSENAEAFYYKGLVKNKMGLTGCDDFITACDLGYKLACYEYDETCYPKTGFKPYEKVFGRGISNIYHENSLQITADSKDYVMVLYNTYNKKIHRAQFVRKNEVLTMNNIPNGTYNLKYYGGNAWSFSKILDRRNETNDIDDVMGGFLKNSETQRIKDLWVFKNSNTSWSLKFGVAEGNIESDDITLDEFLND